MKTSTILLLAVALAIGLVQRSAEAQVGQQRQMQNQNALAGANQGQAFAAQFQSGQLAQVMLANFDRDGDGMLNAVELQAALTAFLVRMSANNGLLQMQQLGAQGIQQPAAVAQNAGAAEQIRGFQGRRGMPAGGHQRGGGGRGR